jgi:integration host factor subunit beta
MVQQFFDEITSELAQGNRLEFRDFGVFEIGTTPPRMAQNPRTLKKVQVPAIRRVVFRAGRMMKEGLNDKCIDGRVTAAPAPKPVNE